MNPYQILNISPTDDKMAIRRAYVRACKLHHPDAGGNSEQLQRVQLAYDGLVNNKFDVAVIETSIALSLADLMNGCIATVVIGKGVFKGTELEFRVPPFTHPETYIEFYDKDSTNKKIRVKINELQTKRYTRLDSNIVIRHTINMLEAELGITFEVVNFDNITKTITVSPETTADRLIYSFGGEGFYDKNSQVRGNLTVIVEIDKKRYLDV
jgi:DnaJ-class molecular chaperone